jgi:6-phosphofructokinase 2
LSQRILVVSTHPAVDVEWRVNRIVPEEKNLISAERRWPGGKGINVARWLKWLGAKPTVLLPLGGSTGDELSHGLKVERINYRAVPIREANRANVVVSQEMGPQYRFNAVRPRLSASEARAFRTAFDELATQSDLVIISGTLAPGLPLGFYQTLVTRGSKLGKKTILDCDGGAFLQGIRAHPSLVKPNEFELGQWAGKPLSSESAIRESAEALSHQTRNWVLVSRGAAGAMLVNQPLGIWESAPATKTRVRNTVGAGDAMVAAVGWAMVNKADPADWLAASLVTAGVLTGLPPGELPSNRLGRPRILNLIK